MNKCKCCFIVCVICLISTTVYPMIRKVSKKKHHSHRKNPDIVSFDLGQEENVAAISLYYKILGRHLHESIVTEVAQNFKDEDKLYVFDCKNKKSVKDVKEKLFKKYPVSYRKSSPKNELRKANDNLFKIANYVDRKVKVPQDCEIKVVSNSFEVHKKKTNLTEKSLEKFSKKLSQWELYNKVQERHEEIRQKLEELEKIEIQSNQFRLSRKILVAMEEWKKRNEKNEEDDSKV